jgi:hypothetical protein
VFDARVWHQGNPAASRERVVLFIHYHRAEEPRIPLMLDYERQLWAKEPSPYFTTGLRGRLRTDLARLPWWYRRDQWMSRVRGWR